MIIVDASIALAWSLDDEKTALGDVILDRVIDKSAVVPTLWKLEVANVLQMSIRRGRISAERRDQILSSLKKLPITIDRETHSHAWDKLVELSDKYALTIYDAAYLELAMRRGLPLATLDKQLIAAARAAGVPVLPDSLP